MPSIDDVDDVRPGVNAIAVPDYSTFVGPINLELTVTRDTEDMIYGGICFVAFGVEYDEP